MCSRCGRSSSSASRLKAGYAHVVVSEDLLPWCSLTGLTCVPGEALSPPGNLRRVDNGSNLASACALPAEGAITGVRTNDDGLGIEGWAPWFKGSRNQGLRIESGQPVEIVKLETILRPDIAVIVSGSCK